MLRMNDRSLTVSSASRLETRPGTLLASVALFLLKDGRAAWPAWGVAVVFRPG